MTFIHKAIFTDKAMPGPGRDRRLLRRRGGHDHHPDLPRLAAQGGQVRAGTWCRCRPGPTGEYAVIGQAGLGVLKQGQERRGGRRLPRLLHQPGNSAKLAQFFPPPRAVAAHRRDPGQDQPAAQAGAAEDVVIDGISTGVVKPSHTAAPRSASRPRRARPAVEAGRRRRRPCSTGVCDRDPAAAGASDVVLDRGPAVGPRPAPAPFWTTGGATSSPATCSSRRSWSASSSSCCSRSGWSFWYSLHEWNVLAGTFDFVGADNYQSCVADPNLPAVLRATAFFSAGLVVLQPGAGAAAGRAAQPEAARHHGLPDALLLAGGRLAGRLDHRLELPAAGQRRHQRAARRDRHRRPELAALRRHRDGLGHRRAGVQERRAQHGAVPRRAAGRAAGALRGRADRRRRPRGRSSAASPCR